MNHTERMLDALRRTRAILTDFGWIQGHSAEAADGTIRIPHSPDAVRFCALGALRRATATAPVTRLAARDALDATVREWTGTDWGLMSFNDSEDQTKEGVLHLFDVTIERLEGRRKAAVDNPLDATPSAA